MDISLRHRSVPLVPGLLLVAGVTVVSLAIHAGLSSLLGTFPVAPLTLAVLFGMVFANIFPPKDGVKPGLKFVSRRILRLAIILMGFRLSWSQIAAVGPGALAIVVLGSGLTFTFTLFLGRKLQLPRDRAILLAAGTSVCGAAAIAAVDGCLGAKEEDIGFALACVTLFGTVFLFLDPVLRLAFNLPTAFYAVWVGASVHEVAQVAAAAAQLSPDGQTLASTVKLIRVLFILPITLVLSFLPLGQPGTAAGTRPVKRKITVPWFALGFFAASGIVSLGILPGAVVKPVLDLDTLLLTAAMGALGLGIDFRQLLKMEFRSVWLGLLPTLFLVVVGAGLTAALVHTGP